MTKPTRFIEYDGKRMGLRQWAREVGISPSTLLSRLRSGWSVEGALTVRTRMENRRDLRVVVYSFIVEWKRDTRGIPPSMQEIAEGVGYSTSNVYSTVKALEEDGWLEVGPRGISVVGSKWVGPGVDADRVRGKKEGKI